MRRRKQVQDECQSPPLEQFRNIEQFRNTRRLFECSEEWLLLPPQRPRPVAGDPGDEKATWVRAFGLQQFRNGFSRGLVGYPAMGDSLRKKPELTWSRP